MDWWKKYFLCKHEKLSLIPKNPHKKPYCYVLLVLVQGGRNRRILNLLDKQPHLISEVQANGKPFLKNKAKTLRKTPEADIWLPHRCTCPWKCTCMHKYFHMNTPAHTHEPTWTHLHTRMHPLEHTCTTWTHMYTHMNTQVLIMCIYPV